MQEGDLKRNGHVDYEEFSRVMRSGVSGSVDSLSFAVGADVREVVLFLYWGGSPGQPGCRCPGGLRRPPTADLDRARHLRRLGAWGLRGVSGLYEVAGDGGRESGAGGVTMDWQVWIRSARGPVARGEPAKSWHLPVPPAFYCTHSFRPARPVSQTASTQTFYTNLSFEGSIRALRRSNLLCSAQ